MLGNGNGTFQPPLTISPSSGYIAVGFFNGDRIQDVAILGRFAGAIEVLLGNGDGTFQAALSFDTGVPAPLRPNGKRSLAIGDFNGDGSQDLVATNVAGSVSVLLGNGNGTFRAPLIFDTGFSSGGGVYSVGVGDFNNDHVQDLAVGIDGGPGPASGFSVLLGNGNGTFRPPSFFSLGSINGIASIAVGDFNNDGIHDLILGGASRFTTPVAVSGGQWRRNVPAARGR